MRVREGGRRGVGSAGGTGSSVVVVNVDVDEFTLTPPTFVSRLGEVDKGGWGGQ